jgi:hypothetical protein
MSVKRYLANGFTYDENPPSSTYPLQAFLFETHRGYCQQFAGAMALLLRMGGIPARVATGFTTGSFDDATHSYVVTDFDAHAWVEAWFPHYGWVRFDPTPPSAPARGGHLSPAPIKSAGAGGGSGAKARHALGGSGNATGSVHVHRGGGIGVVPVVALVLGAALLVLALRVIVQLREPTTDELLAELERAFARCRRPLDTRTTLADLEQRLRAHPHAREYVQGLRLSRYAGVVSRPSKYGRRALREHLARGLGLGRWVRVYWAVPPRLRLRLPASGHSTRGIH